MVPMKRAYLIEANVIDLLLMSPNFRYGGHKNSLMFTVFTKWIYINTLYFYKANCAA